LDGEPVAPTVYPVSDGHSWREGVDAATAGDSGTDADDEW
jgi:predicted heme/steroid binding protein